MLRDYEILFGTRRNSGWKRECQKNRLMDILKDDQVYLPGLRFKSTKGSRFGIHQNNTVASFYYHEKIVQCIEEAKEHQSKWQIKRLERCLHDNTTKWEINRLFIGCFTMLWIGIGRRLLTIENADLTVTEKKQIARKAIERFGEIISGDNKFEILQRFCITATKQGCETLAIDNMEHWMESADGEVKFWINQYLMDAAEKSLWKIKKDSETLLQLPDSDEKIQTTNRFTFITLQKIIYIIRLEEGVFSRWKRFEALYETMADHKIESLTRAVTNKVDYAIFDFYL